MKPIEFHGNSRKNIKNFPDEAKQESGHQLFRVQNDLDPVDWKPMQSIGPGVREIRIKSEGQYRIIYVAKFNDAVHVLHAFQKKTQKTPQKDINIARQRYKEIKGAQP